MAMISSIDDVLLVPFSPPIEKETTETCCQGNRSTAQHFQAMRHVLVFTPGAKGERAFTPRAGRSVSFGFWSVSATTP